MYYPVAQRNAGKQCFPGIIYEFARTQEFPAQISVDLLRVPGYLSDLFFSPFSLKFFKCSISVVLEEQYNSELGSFINSSFCAMVLLFALHILPNIWCVTSFPSPLAQYNPHRSTLKDPADLTHIMTPLPTLQFSPWELWKSDSTPSIFLSR